jgi:hypothetical protein
VRHHEKRDAVHIAGMPRARSPQTENFLSVLAFGVPAVLVCLPLLFLYTAGKDADRRVVIWWAFLSGVSIANIRAWFISRREFFARAKRERRLYHLTRVWQVPLSGIFTGVCAIRSFFPRADVQRIVLFDGFISSVLVGRSLATVAELSLMAQLSLLTWEVSRHSENRFGMLLAKTIVPLIAVAETFSWYSTITTSYLGNCFEESIWAFCSFLLVLGAVSNWSSSNRTWKRILAALMALGTAHVLFEAFNDVPMYVSRYRADEAAHKATFSFLEGISNLAHYWRVTYSWADWQSEIAWLSFYFSIVVWASIWITHAPPPPKDLPAPAEPPGGAGSS